MDKLYRCQVFTPVEKVNKLLDSIDYNHDLYGKKFLENSCGNGAVLSMAVERYIQDCLKNNFDLNTIKDGLEKDIWAFEIDSKKYKECLKNINDIVNKYGIYEVKWNILKKDFLKYNLPYNFSYIAGNPPYINYRDLSDEDRIYVKNNFSTCKKGKFDYCYAFIEKSIDCLDNNGKLAYLIPSSIFKNVYAESLRNYILPDITMIIDFKTEKVFEEALVATSILICDKKSNAKSIIYKNEEAKIKRKIQKKILNGKWIFIEESSIPKNKKLIKFGDLYNASISIATLLNEAFVINEKSKNKNIEKQLLKPAKSPRNLAYAKEENIIFPYFYKNNKLERYSEKDFVSKYPKAFAYLKEFKDKLDNRNKDVSAKWFEYGRSQALSHLNQEKLLMSTVVTNSIKVYELEKNDIPYAGIYIVSKNGNSLTKAQKILQSDRFLEYVSKIGIQASGSSLRITAKDVNNYEFCLEEI